MCGIAGIFTGNGERPEERLVAAMTDRLAHRGPDDRGIASMPGAALGHRRLSILDLDSGRQPMSLPGTAMSIVFNGEIFNYLELRSELESRGARFRTGSDTEVLLAAFAEWDLACLERLNGQFAFALYDERERRMILARDRMGEKPLYRFQHAGSWLFASELKSILTGMAELGAPVELDLESIDSFHSLNYVPFDRTFVAGLELLPPGTCMDLRPGSARSASYSWGFEERAPSSISAARGRLGELLDDAIRLRLRSDVPVGIFLSGGVDSSAIAAGMAAQKPGSPAFVADFAARGFSEEPVARQVSERLGLECRAVRIDPQPGELPGLIENLVDHADTPLADSSALPVYLLSRETARHVKVVLSGDGGDELFGGYATYRASLLAKRIPVPLRRLGAAIHPLFEPLSARRPEKVGLAEKLERFTRNLDLSPGAAHFAWNGMFRLAEKARLLSHAIRAAAGPSETFEKMARTLGVDERAPGLKELLLADQRSYLHSDILTKADRMTMAHGLEARPVLMDPRIVSLARSLPESFLVSRGRTRLVLEELLRVRAPWYDLARPKQGFSIPVHHLLRTSLAGFAGDLFSSKLVEESGIYKADYLRGIWDAHLRRRRNIGFELWGVMIALLWFRKLKEASRSAVSS